MLKCSPEEHPFFEVSWKISNKCNYNCPYCVRVLKEDDEKPDYIGIALLINEMFDSYRPENGQLYITGGEPMLWPIETLCDGVFNSPWLKLIRITSNMSLPKERYLLTRRILENKGKKFLLKGSLHQTTLESQKAFIEKCAECLCDTINIVCNDDNYADYLLLLQNYNFDGNRTIEVNGRKIDINWMVERLTGGGVSDRVKNIPRKSRTFSIANCGCLCSAGMSTIRVEPNGDLKLCASTPVIGNIKESIPERINKPYHCTRKTCPGCYNIWVYDTENINFIHRFKHNEFIRGKENYE